MPPLTDLEVMSYLVSAARVPRHFAALAVRPEFEQTPAWMATDAITDERPLLVLAGTLGVGKTTAATRWLALWARACRGSALFVPAIDLTLADVRGGALDRWRDAGALVLDDLGREYLDDKGWLLSLIEGLVDARYAERRPTVLTTNLAATPFTTRYGERVADRLREAGSFVEVTGPSLRRPGA